MKLQHALVVLLMSGAISAQAEQATLDLLGPPDDLATNTATEATAEAVAENTSAQPAAEQTTQATEAAPAPAPAAPAGMTEQAGFSTGSVTRAAFTSSVENREPTDNLEAVDSEQNQLYFFTELRDMSGHTAKHRWEYNGEVMAEVEFNIKGPRWRVWSSKSFVPGWTGNWKVSVVNGAGDVISEKTFVYETAANTQAVEPATTPAAPANPSIQ